MKILSLKNITHTSLGKKKPALKNVSFDIEQGSYTAIVGHNGSGKTLLARIMASFQKAESGTVTVAPNTKVSLVFQFPKNQRVCNVVSKDVALGLQKLKEDEIELRTIESLMLTGLLHEADSLCVKLSSGQMQKQAISSSIALHPNLLILDDGISMLDPTSRMDIFRFLAYWVHKGNTVIHITHDEQAIRQAQNVIMLEKGKIVFAGTLKSFIAEKTFSEKILKIKIPKNKRNKKIDGNIVFAMKNISFSYENELVLKNIDFELQQGTLTALTGISGSGKTTLLELAEGLLVPKNGKVFSIGRPVLCMQNNEDSFSNLSSGEQKLISIKSACDTDADILLFDEPTSFLDAKEKKDVLDFFRSLCNNGKTILFTTRNKDEADFADREIILFDGAVINDTDSAIKKKDMFLKEAKNLSEQLPFKEAKLIKKLQKKLSKEKQAKSNRIKHLLVLLKPLSFVHIPTKKIIIFLESIFHFVPFVIEEYSLIVKANLIQKKSVSFFENWSLIFGRVSKRLEIFKEAFGGRFP